MKYKGIIFDFNGILLWDTNLHEIAWNEISLELRKKPFTQEEMSLHMHGVEGRLVIDYLLDRKSTDEEFHKILNKKEKRYQTMCLSNPDQFKLSPGTIPLLDYLKENQIPRAIATTSPKINMDFFIDKLHLDNWFQIDKCISIDGSFPGKPYPDIYLKTAKVIGQLPKNCIAIEDAISGIKAAHAAGIGYIVALGPKQKHEDLLKLEGVKDTIEDLSQFNKKLFE